MKKITVNAALLNELDGIREDVEICDLDGNIIAVVQCKFTPEEWIGSSEITNEELERRANSLENGYSTQEVLAHLQSL